MKAKRWWFLVVVNLVLCTLPVRKCSAIETITFHSRFNGYSLRIPKTWKKIPQNVVSSHFNALLTKGTKGKVQYEAAFQLGKTKDWFEYPFVTVVVIRYTSLGIRRAPTRREMEDVVESIIDARDPSKLANYITKEAINLVDDCRISEPSFDAENIYRFFTETKIPDTGWVKGENIGHFGKKALVQISFYNLGTHWEQTKQVKDSILTSFKFDSQHDYKAPSIFERIQPRILKNLFFMIVGLCGCLYGVWQIVKAVKGRNKN